MRQRGFCPSWIRDLYHRGGEAFPFLVCDHIGHEGSDPLQDFGPLPAQRCHHNGLKNQCCDVPIARVMRPKLRTLVRVHDALE